MLWKKKNQPFIYGRRKNNKPIPRLTQEEFDEARRAVAHLFDKKNER